MAKSQENGPSRLGRTILLGLKDYKVDKTLRVGEVWGGEDRVVETAVKAREKCPYCGSGRLYGHGMCKPRAGN